MMTTGAMAQQAVQWRVEDGGNGHWYRAVDAATGDSAIMLAASLGGNLATIANAGENAFVKQVFLATGKQWAWLGLRQASGQVTPGAGWYWVTGEPLKYLNWTDHNGAFPTGAPDDSPCALPPWGIENGQANQGVMDQTGRWDDLEDGMPICGSPVWNNVAIIEWSADCNNDGLVDYGQIRDGSLPDYNGNNVPDCCESGSPCVVGSYPVQWRVQDGGNGHWYAVRSEPMGFTWLAARQKAQAVGGDLASLGRAGCEAFVRGLLTNTICGGPTSQAGPYVGGYQDRNAPDYLEPAGGWRWVDNSGFPGAATVATDNHLGNQDYLHFIATTRGCSGNWVVDDVALQSNNRSYIVEWSAECNSDGIVDYGQILSGQLADVNQNGVPDICEADPCPGDITGNGVVDGVDLSIVLATWLTDGDQGKVNSDRNGDGIVNGQDLAIVLAGWGACP
jgi:hypothetical protein